MPSPRRTPASRRDNLALVEQLLAEAARTPGHLGQAATYVLARPGKRVRARLTLDRALHGPRPTFVLHTGAAALDSFRVAEVVAVCGVCAS